MDECVLCGYSRGSHDTTCANFTTEYPQAEYVEPTPEHDYSNASWLEWSGRNEDGWPERMIGN